MINPFESIVERLDMLDKKLDLVKSMIDTKSPEHEKDSPLTVNDASMYLQLKKNTIYYMTSRKMIPFFKRGRHLFFFKSELVKWLKASRNNQAMIRDTTIPVEHSILSSRKRQAYRIG